ncbi:hypothetical protein ONZ51_g5223 [Trametes cubensis]|uniref:Glycolipid transfer protein domain-containing protein n=1 Tax=Trametes cubensis TaxID=1111947 RepID=A0AAD7X9L0_9APHY|nr:hypothetical protein ONZ51_g5223 [Trametes cubensis]
MSLALVGLFWLQPHAHAVAVLQQGGFHASNAAHSLFIPARSPQPTGEPPLASLNTLLPPRQPMAPYFETAKVRTSHKRPLNRRRYPPRPPALSRRLQYLSLPGASLLPLSRASLVTEFRIRAQNSDTPRPPLSPSPLPTYQSPSMEWTLRPFSWLRQTFRANTGNYNPLHLPLRWHLEPIPPSLRRIDLLGGGVFAFVQNDLRSNITGVKHRYEVAPAESPTLEKLVTNECNGAAAGERHGTACLVRLLR